jgi:N-methylhydantoinase A
MPRLSETQASKIGVDVGGTFTDLFSYDADLKASLRSKVFSTPEDFSIGVLEAVSASKIDIKKIDYFIHGSTIATNAAIERTYSVTPFITTKGFRDLTLIGRYHRRFLYDPYQKKPLPFVKRRHIYEISERLSSSGKVYESVDIKNAKLLAHKIVELGASSVAVGFINSYANPIHEEQIRDIIQQIDSSVYVSLSSVIPKFRALERFTTAIIRACLQSVVRKYLENLNSKLKEEGFGGRLMIVTNNGGMIDAKLAIERPELMLTSGPTSGVNAALFISERIGNNNLITMDMGGTSCDVSIIEKGKPLITSEYELAFDLPVNVPMLDIRTIGAGGGSIAWIDEGGSLRVGPKSAGSFPGPACYGKGGIEPTVTDANLLLGRINKRKIFGKEIRLNYKASELAVKKLSSKIGLDLLDAAVGILTIVNENMAAALKQVSLDRGRDPRDFCLVAFGGAGPMHAAFLAKNLGINRVIIPKDAGIFSAFGGVVMDFKHDFEETFYNPIDEVDLDLLNMKFGELDKKALKSMSLQGINENKISTYRNAQIRFIGQTYEVQTPIPSRKIGSREIEIIKMSFYDEHEREYSIADRRLPIAFVNLRTTAIGHVEKPKLELLASNDVVKKEKNEGKRSVFFENCGFIDTVIFDRRFLKSGLRFNGPVIIEDDSSTIIVPPKMRAEIDSFRNVIIGVR